MPTWHGGILDKTMAGDVLLPAADAEIAPTTFVGGVRRNELGGVELVAATTPARRWV